jgi:glycosyltransferase involved in cell wall biosynthesis
MNLILDGWLLGQGGHGMASFARTLAAGLLRSTWRNRLRIAVPGDVSLDAAVAAVRLNVARPGLGNPPLAEYIWQGRVSRRAHQQGDALLAPAPFRGTARLRRSVVVCHDLIPLAFPRYLGRYYYRRFIFQSQLNGLRSATCVITDSRHTAAQLAEHFGAAAPATVTVPLWTNYADGPPPGPADRERARARYELPDRYWLYVGGYDYRKNVESLIAAYAQARRVVACPSLVLAGRIPGVGRAPVCDVPGACRRAGLDAEAVRLPGYIESADLAAVYASAELFVYPSLAEGFGLPPVEAMANGCPALVADATSLPEVVTDAGYRFAPLDVTALAARLVEAARVPLPLNPSFERDRFSSARGVRDYVAVLDRVVPEHD